MNGVQLNRCIPVGYIVFGEHLLLQMLEAPSTSPADPFIHRTERRQEQSGAARHLVAVHDSHEPAPDLLAGFVFHSSRCGSTLLCNMLEAGSDCFVVRESPVLNRLLNDPTLMPEQRSKLLRAVTAAYCRYADHLGQRCVVKFSSHCALHLPYLADEYPTVPWTYLYRAPQAVVASLMGKTPGWVSTEFLHRALGIDMEELPSAPEGLAALMLQRCFASVAKINGMSRFGTLYAYEQLSDQDAPAAQGVARHFGFGITDRGAAAMRACLGVDAKTGKPLPRVVDSNDLQQYEASCSVCELDYEYLCSHTS